MFRFLTFSRISFKQKLQAIGIGLLCLSAPSAPCGERPAPAAVVRVFDYAGVPASVLRAAAENANVIFRQAGVDMEWRLCAPRRERCSERVDDTDLVVRIIHRSALGGHAFGTSFRPLEGQGVYASLFYDRISDAAQRDGSPVAMLLACAISHEMGELLGLVHSPSGIMHAAYDRGDVLSAAEGHLTFDPAQSAQLRAAIASRAAAVFPPRRETIAALQGQL